MATPKSPFVDTRSSNRSNVDNNSSEHPKRMAFESSGKENNHLSLTACLRNKRNTHLYKNHQRPYDDIKKNETSSLSTTEKKTFAPANKSKSNTSIEESVVLRNDKHSSTIRERQGEEEFALKTRVAKGQNKKLPVCNILPIQRNGRNATFVESSVAAQNVKIPMCSKGPSLSILFRGGTKSQAPLLPNVSTAETENAVLIHSCLIQPTVSSHAKNDVLIQNMPSSFDKTTRNEDFLRDQQNYQNLCISTKKAAKLNDLSTNNPISTAVVPGEKLLERKNNHSDNLRYKWDIWDGYNNDGNNHDDDEVDSDKSDAEIMNIAIARISISPKRAVTYDCEVEEDERDNDISMDASLTQEMAFRNIEGGEEGNYISQHMCGIYANRQHCDDPVAMTLLNDEDNEILGLPILDDDESDMNSSWTISNASNTSTSFKSRHESWSKNSSSLMPPNNSPLGNTAVMKEINAALSKMTMGTSGDEEFFLKNTESWHMDCTGIRTDKFPKYNNTSSAPTLARRLSGSLTDLMNVQELNSLARPTAVMARQRDDPTPEILE